MDIAQFGDLPAVQAYANGTDLKIISTLWESDNAYWIVAGKDSGITKVDDLKGKKIGVPAGTNQHKFVEKVIAKEGFTDGKDITVVNLDTDASTAALISGDVDAIEVDTGNLNKVLEQTGGIKITNNKDYEPSTVVILANNKFAKKNPDTVVRFLKVLDQTNQWITENQDEADQIVADTVGGTKEDAHAYYDVRKWSIGWNQDLTDTINGTIQFAKEQGNISKEFDASDLIDTTYLEKAGLYKKQ